MEVVESFPYLGSLIHCTGYRSPEIKRRVSITRDCMMALDRNIWRSRFSVGTKLRLYNSCILLIFLYGAETWAVTATVAKIRCSWSMVSTPHPEYTLDRAHHQQRGPIMNPTAITVWHSPLQMPSLLWSHLQRADDNQDHSRALYASTTGLPKHWRRRPDQPRQTWLRTIENNLQPLNLGLATAQRRAQNRTAWQTLVEMATSLTSSGWWWTYASMVWHITVSRFCKVTTHIKNSKKDEWWYYFRSMFTLLLT